MALMNHLIVEDWMTLHCTEIAEDFLIAGCECEQMINKKEEEDNYSPAIFRSSLAKFIYSYSNMQWYCL